MDEITFFVSIGPKLAGEIANCGMPKEKPDKMIRKNPSSMLKIMRS